MSTVGCTWGRRNAEKQVEITGNILYGHHRGGSKVDGRRRKDQKDYRRAVGCGGG